MSKKSFRMSLFAALLLPVFAASAGTTGHFESRDVWQQKRIQSGLQSNRLTADEAGRLELGQSRINWMQSQALRDGQVSRQEAGRIEHAQDAQSRAIHDQAHDAQRGWSNSQESRVMQSDVQRNLEQDRRILAGTRYGTLTNRENARLDYGQAASTWTQSQAQATGDGINRWEQRTIDNGQDWNSRQISQQSHDWDDRYPYGGRGY